MYKIIQDLIKQYVEAVKKFMVPMCGRSFYMDPMQEEIFDRIPMWIL